MSRTPLPIPVLQLRPLALLLLLPLLLHPPGVACGPWDLGSYQLCSFVKLEGLSDNASGAAYVPETGTVWVVINNPPGLNEYDLSGKLLRWLDLWWLHDTEDVVYLSPGRVAVVEEPPGGAIRVLDVTAEGGGRLLETIAVDVPRSSGYGLEGLAYDPGANAFYVAQEKHPKRIVRVPRGGGAWSTMIDGDTAYSGVGDLSAVYFVPSQLRLFVLSQESCRLLRSTLQGVVEQEMEVRGSRPEGVAFSPDGALLLVVSEPNEMAVYRADGCGDGGGGSSSSSSNPNATRKHLLRAG